MELSMIGPVLGQVGLTLVMWIVMYARRLPAMAAAKPTPEEMQVKENLLKLPASARFAAENYNHQFEMPVLFYVMCFAAMMTGTLGGGMVNLAWAYVALRAIHAVIHVTYNKVIHRFLVFCVSSIVLMIMFVKLALAYWS